MVALARPAAVAVTREIAFEAIYQAHVRYVAGVVHRIMGGRDAAEVDDIVQDAFLDAIEELEDLGDPATVRAWLVTVAVRRTRRILARRRRRALFAFWAKDYAPHASDPRDRGPVDELYDVLARLPEDLRIPWVLHRVEQLSLPETAAVCEVSLATVKRRIHDAEARIDRRLSVTR